MLITYFKSSAAFRDDFECFHFVGGTVTFPANAAIDTKPIQAKFTLTVQK